MVAQIAAVGGLVYMWRMDSKTSDTSLVLTFLVAVIIVAFATAVIVNLWDWLRGVKKRSNVVEIASSDSQRGARH
jgi:hypothetical protein